jgi:hypothetical protein
VVEKYPEFEPQYQKIKKVKHSVGHGIECYLEG